MFYYTVSVGNPEGTDFTLHVEHATQFSDDDFQDICEQAIVETLEETERREGYAFVSSIDTELLIERLKQHGFVSEQKRTSYYLEPWWGLENVRSRRLVEIIEDSKKEVRLSSGRREGGIDVQ